MKKLLLLFILIQFSVLSQNTKEKYHRAKIVYNSAANFEKLELAGLPMDHGFHKKGHWLTSDFSDSEIAIAKSFGMQVDIEIKDVQQFYVDQNNNTQTNTNPQNISCSETLPKVYPTPLNFNLGTMGGYLTYSQMLQELDDMHALYPNLIAARSNIGTFLTSENRAIQWTKITNNVGVASTRPQILYSAIHHAREPISMMQTIFYMWYLLENYATNDEVKYIVDNTEMYFIPVINADGYVHNETTNPNGGGMWRKNRRNFNDGNFGTDNNRNYDYWVNGNQNQSIWNTLGVSASTSGETYPGTAAFSEPENQAIKYFVETHNFKIALNAHTYSNLLLYPYGYDLNVPSPDDLLFQKISKLLVQESNYTNQISADLYAASGDSDDWMYGQTFNHSKIYAFTPEIGSSFWPAISSIIPLCNEMMFTNINASKMLLNSGVAVDKSPEYIGANATFSAQFELTHYGLLSSGNYTVTINPISSNITSVGAPFTSNSMTTIESITNSIQIGLTSGTTSGDLIIYELVVNNGQTIEKVRVSKKFGDFQTIFSDNASSITPNWTSSTASAWGTTNQTFVSSTSCITDSPNGNYLASQTKTITYNNPINLTTATGAIINYWTKFDLENNFDYVQFQISTNNGLSWISQCGKYTNEGSTETGQPSGGLYDGKQLDWIKETINLSEYIGQTIKVRFRFKSDGFEQEDGFYFDDFEVKLLQNSILKTSDNSVSQYSIYPNPAHEYITINSNNINYSISILNLQGQLISKMTNINGSQKVSLQNIASGVYFIQLESDDKKEIKKIFKK